ncbi:MAG: hypothetical protein J5804_01950 [Eggerthellaceae bacterium]|nr:hypothetical protein [Eggerthellaceae bacterium]
MVKMTKTIARAMVLLACLMALGSAVAWADSGAFGGADTETNRDTAGNIVTAGNSVSINQDIERDVMAAGNQIHVSQNTIGGDIVAAGQRVDVEEVQVAGNVRAAGSEVNVTGAQTDGNITVAGGTVNIDKDTEAAAVYAVGAKVNYSGSANYVALSGSQIDFNGTVDGDVLISADSVSVGKDAQVTGTLTVVGAQPEVADGAQADSLDVQLANEDASDNVIVKFLLGALVSLLTMMITVAAIFWLAPKKPQDSLFMLKARTAPMLVTGVVALLVAPIVVAILFITGIGVLLGAVLLCLIVALAALGLPFMSSAIAQRLMHGSKLWIVAIVAAVIAGIISCIPVLNVLGIICGGAYIAGYVLQLLFLKLKARGAQPVQQ